MACLLVLLIVILGSNMFFHALKFARSDVDVKNKGKCINVCQILRQTLINK